MVLILLSRTIAHSVDSSPATEHITDVTLAFKTQYGSVAEVEHRDVCDGSVKVS